MKMNKIALTFLILFISGIVSAQSKSDRIYDSFNTADGCSQFSFSKTMLDVVNLDFDDQNKTITGDLNQIRFLSYNPQKGEISGPQFMKKAIAMLPSAYRKIDPDDEEKDNIEAWFLGNKKKASEFHLFIRNDDPEGMYFLVSFYGNFNINDIDKLSHIGINLSKDN